jgi:hypothetical protein
VLFRHSLWLSKWPTTSVDINVNVNNVVNVQIVILDCDLDLLFSLCHSLVQASNPGDNTRKS